MSFMVFYLATTDWDCLLDYGEADKQPTRRVWSQKCPGLANLNWLLIAQCKCQLSRSYPLETKPSKLYTLDQDLDKWTSHLIKTLGEDGVCYSTESQSQVNEHHCQNLLPHSRSDNNSVPRNIYSAVFTPAKFEGKSLSLKHFFWWETFFNHIHFWYTSYHSMPKTPITVTGATKGQVTRQVYRLAWRVRREAYCARHIGTRM